MSVNVIVPWLARSVTWNTEEEDQKKKKNDER